MAVDDTQKDKETMIDSSANTIRAISRLEEPQAAFPEMAEMLIKGPQPGEFLMTPIAGAGEGYLDKQGKSWRCFQGDIKSVKDGIIKLSVGIIEIAVDDLIPIGPRMWLMRIHVQNYTDYLKAVREGRTTSGSALIDQIRSKFHSAYNRRD